VRSSWLTDSISRGRVGQHGVDAAAQVVGAFVPPAVEVDRDNAELRVLGRDRADRPGVAVVRGHRVVAGRSGPGGSHLDDLVENGLRHGDLGGLDLGGLHLAGLAVRRVGGVAPAGEQDHLALGDGSEVILDGRMDVRHRERARQAAHEIIEVAGLHLAPARQLELSLQPAGELADYDRDEDVEQQVDHFLRIANAQVVERREEQERRRHHAGKGGNERGDAPPAGGGQEHRNQEENGAAGIAELVDEQVNRQGGDGDRDQGQRDTAQRATETVGLRNLRHRVQVLGNPPAVALEYRPVALVCLGSLRYIASVRTGLFQARPGFRRGG
jgi:hypothetical protein